MNDILDRISQGNLPDHAKEAILSGAMPFEPEVLMSAVYFICRDQPDIHQKAHQTIADLPEGSTREYLVDPHLDPQILEFYLVNFPLQADIKSAAILNPGILPGTLEKLAPTLESDLLQLVVNNQAKIEKNPQIILALRENPGLSITHKQKLEEYERLLLKPLTSENEELDAKPIADVEKDAIEEAKEYVKAFGKEKVSKIDVMKQDKKVVAAGKSQGEGRADEEEGQSTLRMLANLTVPQKIQAAIKGNREIRSILIRDANKLISTAVVKSPKITDAEVEFYSNLRNVHSDVLRIIANNREWTKSYKIVMNLVKNPRTPLDISSRFIPRIMKNDLRQLTRDKGVSEMLRTTARRLLRDPNKR